MKHILNLWLILGPKLVFDWVVQTNGVQTFPPIALIFRIGVNIIYLPLTHKQHTLTHTYTHSHTLTHTHTHTHKHTNTHTHSQTPIHTP